MVQAFPVTNSRSVGLGSRKQGIAAFVTNFTAWVDTRNQATLLAVTGLICMIAGRADIHLFIRRTHAGSVEVTEGRVMNFIHRPISETHLQNDGSVTLNNAIVDPGSEMISEHEFVPVRLIRIGSVCPDYRPKVLTTSTKIVCLYEGIKAIIIKFRTWDLLQIPDCVGVQRGASSNIPILNFPSQSNILGDVAREVGISWSDPSPRTGNKGLTREPVRFNHLIKLAVINPSNYYSGSDGTDLKHNFPKWGWIGIAIGAFGLMCYGCWNLRNEIRIRLGLFCYFIGIALCAYTVGIWICHKGTP